LCARALKHRAKCRNEVADGKVVECRGTDSRPVKESAQYNMWNSLSAVKGMELNAVYNFCQKNEPKCSERNVAKHFSSTTATPRTGVAAVGTQNGVRIHLFAVQPYTVTAAPSNYVSCKIKFAKML
jgi:hypothetical protein